MKKTIVIILTFISISIHMFGDVKEEFLNSVFSVFYDTMDKFNKQYALVSSPLSNGGVMKGSASVGNFPSAGFGQTLSLLFIQNPFKFIEGIKIFNNEPIYFSNTIGPMLPDWLKIDKLIILPVNVYYVDFGLPKGFYGSFHFNIFPAQLILSSFLGSQGITIGLDEFLIWNFGSEAGYTIMDDRDKYSVNLAIGIGFDIQEFRFKIKEIQFPAFNIDANNSGIDAKINFGFLNRITSININLALSKNFVFFEPFIDIRLSQSFYYNEYDITLKLNTSKMTPDFKDFFGDGNISITNKDYKIETLIIPVTDLTFSTGFNFVISVFRPGLGFSYSFYTSKFMLQFDLSFQLENTLFGNKKNSNSEKDENNIKKEKDKKSKKENKINIKR